MAKKIRVWDGSAWQDVSVALPYNAVHSAQASMPSTAVDGQIWLDTDGTLSDTQYIPKTLTSTTGDIIYASSANTPARLGIGTSGQVLTVSGGVPSWSAGGKVLQVVNASTNTAAANTTTTYADTNLAATITPTSTTSKILIILSQDMNKTAGTNAMNVKLLRGATNLFSPQAVEMGIYTVASGTHLELYSHSYGITYLDSPATTSATTYKTQFAIRAGGSGTVYAQGQGSYSTITLMEIGA